MWLRLLKGENKEFDYVDDVTPELSIAILPDYRGHSLGVSLDNPAQRLYQRFGFEVVGESGTSLTMAKCWRSD